MKMKWSGGGRASCQGKFRQFNFTFLCFLPILIKPVANHERFDVHKIGFHAFRKVRYRIRDSSNLPINQMQETNLDLNCCLCTSRNEALGLRLPPFITLLRFAIRLRAEAAKIPALSILYR